MGDEGEALRIAHRQPADVGDVLHQMNAAAAAGVEASHRAFDLRVPGVTDEQHVASLARVTLHLHVHLGHERTGGVEDGELAGAGLLLYRARNAVGGEDHGAAAGYLGELLHEHRAQGAQPLHHVKVVHHLVTHVDRRAEELQRPLHDIDGAVNAGAEAARIGE